MPATAGALAREFRGDQLPPCDRRLMVEFRRKDGWDRGIPNDAVVVHTLHDGNSYLIAALGAQDTVQWGQGGDIPVLGHPWVAQRA